MVRNDSKSSALSNQMRIEKYGLYNGLLSNFKLPAVLHEFITQFPKPIGVKYLPPADLNSAELLSNFSFHLMLLANESDDLKECKKFYEIVKQGTRLSASEKLVWEARIFSKQILK